MRAIIKEQSRNAIYIPCCADSLNLVGHCAVECFSGSSKVVCIFSCSTKRWKVLMGCLSKCDQRYISIKSLSETRWQNIRSII